jgi:hypothetical protein
MHQRLVDPLLIDAKAVQDARRRALALAADRDQQVLDPDKLIGQAGGLFLGALDQALGAWGDIDLVAVAILAIYFGRLFQLALDAPRDRVGIDAKPIERAARQAILLAQHCQENVLHIQLGVVLLVHDLLSFLESLLRLIGESFQSHGSLTPLGGIPPKLRWL